MKLKPLDALEGTEYEAIVTRDPDIGFYTLTVQKPAVTDDIYAAYEVVAAITLPRDATATRLNNEVAKIIATDTPSLVGDYVAPSMLNKEGEEKVSEEQH